MTAVAAVAGAFLVAGRPSECAGLELFAYPGAAWLDPTTLRIARYDLRAAPDNRVSRESLHLLSRTVPD